MKKEKEEVKKLTGKTKRRNVSYRNSAKGLLNSFKETFKAFQTDDVGVNNINIEEIEDLKEGFKEVQKLEKEYYGIVDTKKEVKFGIDKTSNNKNNNLTGKNKEKDKNKRKETNSKDKVNKASINQRQDNKKEQEQKSEKEHKTTFLDKLTNKKDKVKSTNEIFNKKIEEKKKEKQNIKNVENKNKSLDDILKELEENEKKNEEMQKKIMNSEDDIDNI